MDNSLAAPKEIPRRVHAALDWRPAGTLGCVPINFRYSPISRMAREASEPLLELTRGYENLVVPRGLGVAPLAVLGIVARARAPAGRGAPRR